MPRIKAKLCYQMRYACVIDTTPIIPDPLHMLSYGFFPGQTDINWIGRASITVGFSVRLIQVPVANPGGGGVMGIKPPSKGGLA